MPPGISLVSLEAPKKISGDQIKLDVVHKSIKFEGGSNEKVFTDTAFLFLPGPCICCKCWSVEDNFLS
jgi:hypothetical protein